MIDIIFIIQIVDKVITILVYAIIVRAFLSFIPHSPNNPLIRVLYDVTEPILKPFRRFQIGGAAFAVDFSPLIAIIILDFIVRPLVDRLLSLFIGGF